MINNIGFILIIVAIIPVIISIFHEHKGFFNIKTVILEHFKMFKNCKSQYIVFYGSPLLLSVGLAFIYDAKDDFYNNLSVIISIILSMLFAVLAILSSYNYSNTSGNASNILKVVNETINSIVFETMICVFLLLYGMIVIIIHDVTTLNIIVNKCLTGVSCFFFTVLLLDLLVVIKRMSKIIKIKMNERN
ncbi:MAG: hypothetical protein J6O50_06745 [Ruminiclostridium sp.]|nr:hypothetical protein [Ruminiclostridium sp.]